MTRIEIVGTDTEIQVDSFYDTTHREALISVVEKGRTLEEGPVYEQLILTADESSQLIKALNGFWEAA